MLRETGPRVDVHLARGPEGEHCSLWLAGLAAFNLHRPTTHQVSNEKKPHCTPFYWLVHRDPQPQWPLYSKISINTGSIVSSKVQITSNFHCSNVILLLSAKHGKAEHGSVSVSLGKVDPGILRVHVNVFLFVVLPLATECRVVQARGILLPNPEVRRFRL